MKYLLPLLLLASCTSPQIISPLDKHGNAVHSVLKEPFFGAPNQGSEWSFWYVIICLITFYAVWKEFKSVRWPKKKSTDTGASEPPGSV